MKEEKFWILLAKMLSGEVDAQERDEFMQLIESDMDMQQTYDQMKEFWSATSLQQAQDQIIKDSYLAHVARLKDLDPAFTYEEVEEVNSLKPLYTYKRFAFIGTALIGVFFIVFLLFNMGNDKIAPGKATNEITINPGSRSKINLPDGSQVWINSGSRFTYAGDFKGDTREVYLSGEAYFDVAHDKSRPFIVHTSGIDIKVLGTAFNVKAFDVDPTIEATLIRGMIQVVKKNEPNGSTIILKPHEKLIYNKITESYVSSMHESRKSRVASAPLKPTVTIIPLEANIPDTAIAETAWLYNKLTFEEEKLQDLAKRMERWYNIKITITENNLKNYRISGSFVDETADQALKELQLLIPFNYVLKNNEVVISEK